MLPPPRRAATAPTNAPPLPDVCHRPGAIGATHGVFFLAPIVLLLLARGAFFAATQGRVEVQRDEALWYPLVALPELLVVVLFAVPGLVPPVAHNEQDTDPGV